MGIFRPWALSPPFALINPPFFLPHIHKESPLQQGGLALAPSAAQRCSFPLPTGLLRTKRGAPLGQGHRCSCNPSPYPVQGRSTDPLGISSPATIPPRAVGSCPQPPAEPGSLVSLHKQGWSRCRERRIFGKGTAGVMEWGLGM